MKKSIIAAVFATTLAGCSSTETIQGSQANLNCVFPDSPDTEAPAWVCDVMPSDIGVGAVGYARRMAAGFSLQKAIATNEARLALASEIQTRIDAALSQATMSNVGKSGNEPTTEVSSTETNKNGNYKVNMSLQNSRIVVSTLSPAGGIYVLVGMDKKNLQLANG